ncbi:MAG: glycerate kinase [Lachnospiraceae bacterium]
MKIIIAADSFKGSLSSLDAGTAIREGILRADPDACVEVCPLADGGEGTTDALVQALDGEVRALTVTGPTGTSVRCSYGIVKSKKLAVMEMSAAAGITLVKSHQRNPLYTTTFGVGEMIKDAIAQGCRKFIVGIGGSATNDGGIGMLQALGVDFLDSEGKQIPGCAGGLKQLHSIHTEHMIPELSECEFRIACDVTNPLCGENGCSAVFGPQKGADAEMIRDMDTWLSDYAALTKEIYPDADAKYPGSGAAGGMGFAFLSYTNAVLESGIGIIIDETGLEEKIKDADLVITGEGKLDGQTAMGKAPVGVAGIARKYHIPVIAFAGSVTEQASKCNENGISAYFTILRTITTLEEAMIPENASKNLRDSAEQVMRLLYLSKYLK